ncbi:MAG: hypothetical protein R3C19_11215 [Planctomycetaceae bacterium]
MLLFRIVRDRFRSVVGNPRNGGKTGTPLPSRCCRGSGPVQDLSRLDLPVTLRAADHRGTAL